MNELVQKWYPFWGCQQDGQHALQHVASDMAMECPYTRIGLYTHACM